MAVRAGEDLLLSSLLPLASPFLHVVELGYVAHYLYAMGLLRRHGERPIGDVSLAMIAAVVRYGAAFRLTVGSFVAQLFGAAATAWA